jgi:hypothetical protein
MKKLAVIGLVFAGLMLSTAASWAAPTGMTKPEYRALMLRSEGLNQQYGTYRYSRPTLVSEKLAGLELAPTRTSASGKGFNWNDAGMGAILTFGFVVLGVSSLLSERHRNKPIPH